MSSIDDSDLQLEKLNQSIRVDRGVIVLDLRALTLSLFSSLLVTL